LARERSILLFKNFKHDIFMFLRKTNAIITNIQS
jgi:phosphohistidine swiveling domain-containing protein